ncbi:MAG: alpha/beta hydrolase [Alphaproteobacteria bacterium]|nr:alpha/beta hydrolase [Alphaproteobacteria bacterium]
MNRRAVIGLGVAAFGAAQLGKAFADPPASSLGLWPKGPPGGIPYTMVPRISGSPPDRILTGVSLPDITVFRPAAPHGSALLIIPGGGYMQEAMDAEGAEIAGRFAQAGVTGFVLGYRLPREGWSAGPVVALQDAQRAMRLIRAGASSYGIDPARIGVLGFSAGGHLAATLAARALEHTYDAVDEADASDARPNFMALGYPVITMLAPFAHEASREHLLGAQATAEDRAAWSAERLVTAASPPTFLFAAADDPDVVVENTTTMFGALRAKSVPAEMHVFEHGGHAFALRARADMPVSKWPELFLSWGRSRGVFSRAA